MGDIYGGSMLEYFPELLLERDVFKMAPASETGGLVRTETVFKDHEGYLTRNRGGKESVVSKARTENQQARYYCYDKIPRGSIAQGLYVEDDGELYQFVLDNGYPREGGFVRHDLQLVTGNNGKQKPAPKVNFADDFQ